MFKANKIILKKTTTTTKTEIIPDITKTETSTYFVSIFTVSDLGVLSKVISWYLKLFNNFIEWGLVYILHIIRKLKKIVSSPIAFDEQTAREKLLSYYMILKMEMTKRTNKHTYQNNSLLLPIGVTWTVRLWS